MSSVMAVFVFIQTATVTVVAREIKKNFLAVNFFATRYHGMPATV